MRQTLKRIILTSFDVMSYPFSFLYLPILKFIKKHGAHKFPLNRSSFMRFGIYPVRDHFYEPQLKYSATFDDKSVRPLQIAFNIPQQLERLASLRHSEELHELPKTKPADLKYFLKNGAFEEGDADLYCLLIRNHKPRKIIEIGSGFSTLLALDAIERNRREGFDTELTCIEPFGHRWLKDLQGIRFVENRVEDLSAEFFGQLEEGDILFIDSSHVIRPENDVLFEYLRVLPSLNKGVIIHIHDIFTPRHYPKQWLVEELRFWNEQYLLEAFLSFNDSFEILFSLNHLGEQLLRSDGRRVEERYAAIQSCFVLDGEDEVAPGASLRL